MSKPSQGISASLGFDQQVWRYWMLGNALWTQRALPYAQRSWFLILTFPSSKYMFSGQESDDFRSQKDEAVCVPADSKVARGALQIVTER